MSWCRLFSSKSRSCEIQISSILKFFVYCCHSDIDFTKNCILTNFNSYSNDWRKFCGVRTRI